MEDKDYSIQDMFFLGVNLEQKEKTKEGQYRDTRDDEFELKTDTVYDSVLDIFNPVKNGVYLVKSVNKGLDYYIGSIDRNKNDYYLKLFTATESLEEKFGDVKMPVYRVIYYKGGWYQFSNTTYGDGINDGNDVILPTSALIDYQYEIEKGEY